MIRDEQPPMSEAERTATAVKTVKLSARPLAPAIMDCDDKHIMWLALRAAWAEIDELKRALNPKRKVA